MADSGILHDPGPDRDALAHAAGLQQQGAWLDAAAVYASLGQRHPLDHRLFANQGNALWLADLPQAGAEAYRRALILEPSSTVSMRGLASCLRDVNRWPEALEVRQRAAALLPDASVEALGNRWSTSQLLIGMQCWREAFAAMVGRHHPMGAPSPDLLQPRLALETEQGYGDTFQFLRFLEPLVQRRHAAGQDQPLDLWVESNLVDLLQEGLEWLPTPPRLHACSPDEPEGTGDARRITLLDLPHHLGVERIEPVGPYLRSPRWPSHHDAQDRAPLLSRPGHAGPLRVGLCWAAGRKLDDPFTAREYRKRSLPAAILWRLLDGLHRRGIRPVSLQVGDDADLAAALGAPLAEAPEPIASFLGTARVLRQLDLLISVDTALAHLAGAMDRPAWILLPWSADPRWLESGSSSPWYGSLRLFRQPRSGDWHGAIDAVLCALDGEPVHH